MPNHQLNMFKSANILIFTLPWIQLINLINFETTFYSIFRINIFILKVLFILLLLYLPNIDWSLVKELSRKQITFVVRGQEHQQSKVQQQQQQIRQQKQQQQQQQMSMVKLQLQQQQQEGQFNLPPRQQMIIKNNRRRIRQVQSQSESQMQLMHQQQQHLQQQQVPVVRGEEINRKLQLPLNTAAVEGMERKGSSSVTEGGRNQYEKNGLQAQSSASAHFARQFASPGPGPGPIMNEGQWSVVAQGRGQENQRRQQMESMSWINKREGLNTGAAAQAPKSPGPSEGQLNHDLIKALELAEAQKQAAWKTYDLTKCITPQQPLGGLDLPVIGATSKQPKRCTDPLRPYFRYHSKTPLWSMGCCRTDRNVDSYDISKRECCLVGGSRCELNGIPCCNGQPCCGGKCRMTAGFFSDDNLGLVIPYHGQPKAGKNVVPLTYAEYEMCSDPFRPYFYSFSQLHENYYGCCIRPPLSSPATSSQLCCLLARSACDGGIPCCNSLPCYNGRCPIESGDTTWPTLNNVTCIPSTIHNNPNSQINNDPYKQISQQQQITSTGSWLVQLTYDPLMQLADPVYKYFFHASLPNGKQMHAACMNINIGPYISDISTGKQCCLMAGSPCSQLINCCRGVPCCNGRCVKQASSLKDRTGYSITFNECNERD